MQTKPARSGDFFTQGRTFGRGARASAKEARQTNGIIFGMAHRRGMGDTVGSIPLTGAKSFPLTLVGLAVDRPE